jgi:hypothetical protein
MVPENHPKIIYNQINYIGLQNDPYPSQHTARNVHQSFWTLSAKASLGVDRRTLSKGLVCPTS